MLQYCKVNNKNITYASINLHEELSILLIVYTTQLLQLTSIMQLNLHYLNPNNHSVYEISLAAFLIGRQIILAATDFQLLP